MACLPQLIEPDTYTACEWDLKRDAAGRAYWIGHFTRHLELLVRLIGEQYPGAAAGQVNAFRAEYVAAMSSIEAHPERYERIDMLLLDELRGQMLARYGFPDPFQAVKHRENTAALGELPRLLEELDRTPTEKQLETLAIDLMAGNLFDLGSEATVARFERGELGFWQTRRQVPTRPWHIDDVDVCGRNWRDSPARHALVFVDNAGVDICLGCLPLVRWMLRAGTRVTLAANTLPALNDVIAPELEALLADVSQVDLSLAGAVSDGRLRMVASGGLAPLLDLRRLSDECVEAAGDADLLVLLGMGRSVESNADARFSCDSVRAAVLKDRAVAARIGGRLFDCVWRYERGQAPGAGPDLPGQGRK